MASNSPKNIENDFGDFYFWSTIHGKHVRGPRKKPETQLDLWCYEEFRRRTEQDHYEDSDCSSTASYDGPLSIDSSFNSNDSEVEMD